MPLLMMTDCGSELTALYGFANALRSVFAHTFHSFLNSSHREAFSPDLPVTVLPAHLFFKSINNTTIERGWLRMRLQWGDNVIIFWEAGRDIYNPTDPDQ
jgi:hypothetical protein